MHLILLTVQDIDVVEQDVKFPKRVIFFIVVVHNLFCLEYDPNQFHFRESLGENHMCYVTLLHVPIQIKASH